MQGSKQRVCLFGFRVEETMDLSDCLLLIGISFQLQSCCDLSEFRQEVRGSERRGREKGERERRGGGGRGREGGGENSEKKKREGEGIDRRKRERRVS